MLLPHFDRNYHLGHLHLPAKLSFWLTKKFSPSMVSTERTGQAGTLTVGTIGRNGTTTGRSSAIAGAVLMATFLSACTTSSEPNFGLAPQTSAATPSYVDGGTSGSTNPVAVEMSFDGGKSETVTYADSSTTSPGASSNKKPELALAVAPETNTSEALDAVNTAAIPAAATTQVSTDLKSSDKASAKRPRLARIFSFGQPRPPAEIVHVAGGGKTANPSRGATSAKPRSTIRKPQSGQTALPGVRLGSLFGIKSASADSTDEPVRVASAAGLARLAPNGLRAQHDSVQMACFKPELVRLLQRVRKHYRQDIIVTSGYRSPKSNRRAGGARGSRHTTCEAADIQVPGISKWQLAKYLRTMQGRGGVGTYCNTKSVHIDVGSKRDWNWRCRRR